MAAPVTRECPVRCLGLPAHVLNRMRWSCETGTPPCTVGDLLALREEGRLRDFRGIGPQRVAEIETALRRTGLLADHEHDTDGASGRDRADAAPDHCS